VFCAVFVEDAGLRCSVFRFLYSNELPGVVASECQRMMAEHVVRLCVAACCSVLQRVAACCSVLQRVAARCRVVQRVAACCSTMQRVACRACANTWVFRGCHTGSSGSNTRRNTRRWWECIRPVERQRVAYP